MYAVIRRTAAQGNHIAAIVSDERFAVLGDDVPVSFVRASSEVPHLRKALEEAFGDAGSTIPLILISGGRFLGSPPDHAYFLDIECWLTRTWNESNPLYRLLSAALGLPPEALDRGTLRRTTDARLWGDKDPLSQRWSY